MQLTPQQILAQKRLELAFLDALESNILDQSIEELHTKKKPTKETRMLDHDINELKEFSASIKEEINNIIQSIEIGENGFSDNVEKKIHAFQHAIKSVEKKVHEMKDSKIKEHLLKIVQQYESLYKQSFTPVQNTTFQ